jgi:hypothetical protein
VRRERGPRVTWLDLHNLLGIVTLTWALVVGATGMINTWADLLASPHHYGIFLRGDTALTSRRHHHRARQRLVPVAEKGNAMNGAFMRLWGAPIVLAVLTIVALGIPVLTGAWYGLRNRRST